MTEIQVEDHESASFRLFGFFVELFRVSKKSSLQADMRIHRWSDRAALCISLQLQQILRKWERTRSWKRKLLPFWGSFWVSNSISGWAFCTRGSPSGWNPWFNLKGDMCLLQSTLDSCGCCCWWRTARETPALISFRSTSERASARTPQTAWASKTCSPGPARLCWRTFLESTQVKGCTLCQSYSNILFIYIVRTLNVAVNILLWLFLSILKDKENGSSKIISTNICLKSSCN